VRATPPSSQPRRAPDLLLESVAVLVTEGCAVGAPMVRRSLSAFRSEAMSTEERLRWLWLACRAAHDVWDAESWRELATAFVQLARDTGAFTVLPHALAMRSGTQLFAGELASAAALVEEEEEIVKAMGIARPAYTGVALAAWQGHEAEIGDWIEATTSEAVQLGEGQWLTLVHWASAVLYNGLGRYEDALLVSERAVGSRPELAIASWALPELVEAAARCGQSERAADALERLSEITRASGTDWGLGVEAVSRALLSHGGGDERLYREAIERLGRTHVAAVRARAHLPLR
jgi:tetratricopeptide (TPR) repeat protein